MNHLHQIYDYCRAHIDHFDWRSDMALAIMDARRCSLEHANPLLFREMEDCAYAWADENNIYVDYFDDINIEDVFLFGPEESNYYQTREEGRQVLLSAYPQYPNEIDEYLEGGLYTPGLSKDQNISGFEKFMEDNGYFPLDDDEPND